MNKLTSTLSQACRDRRIVVCPTKVDGFYVRGTNGNSVSARSLLKLIERHARSRKATCRLVRDAYAGLRRGLVRTGFLLVEVSDPISRDLEREQPRG